MPLGKQVKEWVSRLMGRVREALRPRRGMNLSDNLFNLGLVAVGIVVILGLGLYGRSVYQEQRASLLVTRLVQAVTSTYQSTRDYGDDVDLLDTLDSFGRLPEAFVVRDGTDITMGAPVGRGGDGEGGGERETNEFRISFAELDDDICAALAERTAAQSRGRSGLSAVVINGTELDLPYTVDDVAGECDEGDESNTLAWDYF